jgi:hypothetical protein
LLRQVTSYEFIVIHNKTEKYNCQMEETVHSIDQNNESKEAPVIRKNARWVDDTDYDVIVVGTSITESLVAG